MDMSNNKNAQGEKVITRAVFKPGQKGTKKLVEQYGERLVCVRYRYDYQQKKRFKTIELVIDEDHWVPPPRHPDDTRPKTKQSFSTRLVGVQIGWDEKDLQERIREIGGRWSRQDKLWYALEYRVRQAGLDYRMVKK
jgi:hypothetical protein